VLEVVDVDLAVGQRTVRDGVVVEGLDLSLQAGVIQLLLEDLPLLLLGVGGADDDGVLVVAAGAGNEAEAGGQGERRGQGLASKGHGDPPRFRCPPCAVHGTGVLVVRQVSFLEGKFSTAGPWWTTWSIFLLFMHVVSPIFALRQWRF